MTHEAKQLDFFLLDLMEEAGLTYKSLADRIGVTATYMTMIKDGTRSPSGSWCRRVEKALDMKGEVADQFYWMASALCKGYRVVRSPDVSDQEWMETFRAHAERSE